MLNECNWRHTCWNFWKRFGDWIHIFAPKPMTITKLAFQFFTMNIEHKMKLKLTIVIGFGAKIWIQSPNLFQIFQQVWRQLHSLSIVDYPKLSMLTTLSRYIVNCTNSNTLALKSHLIVPIHFELSWIIFQWFSKCWMFIFLNA